MLSQIEDSNIEYTFNYHIIPFRFERKYDDKLLLDIESISIVKSKSNQEKEIQVWNGNKTTNGDSISSPNIYKHIRNLVKNYRNNQSIGIKFKLNDEVRSYYGFPSAQNNEIEVTYKKEKFRYKIKSIDLYLFETQIGFVCLEVDFGSRINSEQIIEYNYILRHIHQISDKQLLISKSLEEIDMQKKNDPTRQNNNDVLMEAFDINNSINRLTKILGELIYFEGNSKSIWKSNVFNSICLKNKPIDEMEVKETIYKMHRVFKTSYKPSDRDINFVQNKNMIQTFKNIYWGASLEGCGNLCYLVDEEDTNNFMKSTFKGNVKKEYLYLYMLALHQKYALLNYTAETIKSNADVIDKSELELEDLIMNLLKLKSKIASFFLRGIKSV